MASYTLITMAFLLICSSSFIETSLAARSKLTPATNPLVHQQSEPIRPQSEPIKPPLTTNNNKAQSKDMVAPPYPFYYPLSGPGYPYYGQTGQPGQPGQPYLPNYRFPPVYPYSPYPTTYPYSPYNPTLPYPQGPSIYTPPSTVNARP